MAIYVPPGYRVGRDGGSFQEVTMNTTNHTVTARQGRYCTIRDNEQAPATWSSLAADLPHAGQH